MGYYLQSEYQSFSASGVFHHFRILIAKLKERLVVKYKNSESIAQRNF